MNKIFLTSALSLIFTLAFGQNTILENYFNSVATGRTLSISKADMQSLYADELVLSQFTTYLADPALKRAAIRLLGRVGNKHQSATVRQASVHQLLGFALENDPNLQATIIDKLINFTKEDFDEQALSMMDDVLRSATTHIKDFALLGGFLGRESVLYELRTTYEGSKKIKRNIGFALARCGDQKRISSLLAALDEVAKDDVFLHQIAPILLYIRQKEVFDYLLNILNSDEKNCEAGGDGRITKVLCGYRLMEMMAPYITNFPIKADQDGFIDIDDYPGDLAKVRAWMIDNADSYELISTIY